MGGYADLTLLDGYRNQRTFRWQTRAKTPLNLTGWTAEFHCLDLSENEVFSCTLGDGTVPLDATGTITVVVSATKATGLVGRALQYGLVVVDASGAATTLLNGSLRFKKVGQA